MTSTPQNPDGGDLLDFADAVNAGQNPHPRTDEQRTYLHVQHALQGESAAIPPTTKQSTWEDIMSTLALKPEAPVSNRTRKQRGISTPRFTPKRLQWTPMASIAAAALVIIASFGVWFTSGHESTPPPLAPQMASISTSGDLAKVAATPEATAVHETSGVQSVPIVLNVDEQPMDGPVIWLTTTGDVMYDNGMEVTTIASGAKQVMPMTTNVIQVMTDAPDKDMTNKEGTESDGYTMTYHNLLTGKTLVDDGTFSSYLGGPNTFGPLTVLTIADAPREWSIVNFETMESKSIADLTGGQYRSSESITVAVSDDFSTIAVGTSQYESEASATLMKPSGIPGEVAVIPADLSEPTWVSVPEEMPAVGNISLSPDGSKIAFISADNFRGGSNMTVSVVDIATGEQLERTQRIESSSFSHFQWIEDGAAFVIVSNNAVEKYALDGSEPQVLLESEGTFNLMPQFGQSDLLHLQDSSVELVTTSPQPETTQFIILNTATGDTVEIDGNPWYLGGSYPVTISTSIAPIPVSKDGLTAALVHPITGEEYPDLVANVDDPMKRPDFQPEEGQGYNFLQTVTTASNAPISAVELADGTLAIITTTEDSFETRIIERPADTEGMQLQFSPGGEYLLIGAGWEMQGEDAAFFQLDLSEPDSVWTQSAPGERISFAETNED